MGITDRRPAATHFAFPYFFDNSKGISFGNLATNWITLDGDLFIYYNTLAGSNFMCCRCSRWDTEDYSVTIETWLHHTDLRTLLSNIVPGATGELYQILGRPYMYDQTWQGNNTLRIVPNKYTSYDTYNDEFSGINESTLYSNRNEKIIYVKNITTHPVSYTDWINVKIEGFVSGSSL